MGTVETTNVAVNAHDAFEGRLRCVLGGPTFRSDKVEVRILRPQVSFQIMNVPFVKKLISAQLFVCAKTVTVVFFVGTVHQVFLDGVDRKMRHLAQMANVPACGNVGKRRQLAISLANLRWQVGFSVEKAPECPDVAIPKR